MTRRANVHLLLGYGGRPLCGPRPGPIHGTLNTLNATCPECLKRAPAVASDELRQ